MAAGHNDIRGDIRADLESGHFAIPPFKDVDNDETPASPRVAYEFPPALLDSDPKSISNYRKRFDRSALLPDSNLPLDSQIMGYIQCWCSWISEIPDDDKREKLLDRVFVIASEAWYRALIIGYKLEGATSRRAPRNPSKRNTVQAEVIPAGLRGRFHKKKETDPAKLPVLAALHKNGPGWAITAGELTEAGISMSRIERRIEDKDSLQEEGEELLAQVLQMYEGKITPTQWYNAQEKTQLNPLGRDLQLYCLYEVLRSQASLAQLRGYFEAQKTIKQRENTQKRIDEEEEHRDRFMGLALELEEDDPRPATPMRSLSPEARQRSSSIHVAEDPGLDRLSQLESLVSTTQALIGESDAAAMISAIELLGITIDGLAFATTGTEGLTDTSDQWKQVTREMLLIARQTSTVSSKIDSGGSLESLIKVAEQTEEFGQQMEQAKEKLRTIATSLNEELEAAKAVALADNMLVDAPDTQMADTEMADTQIETMAAETEPTGALDSSDVGNPGSGVSSPSISSSLAHEQAETSTGSYQTSPQPTKLTTLGKRPLDNDNAETTEMATKRQKTAEHEPAPKPATSQPLLEKTLQELAQIETHQDPAPQTAPTRPAFEQTLEEFGRCEDQNVAATVATTVDIQPRQFPIVTSESRPTRAITLYIQPGYDPASFTSEKLFHRQGFNYRYARESTLAQRISIVDTLIRYVDDCCREQRTQKAKRGNAEHIGKYQGLSDPEDSMSTTIIHGVWNLRNGKKDGGRPTGFDAFFAGDVDYAAELEKAFMSDTEDEGDGPVTPRSKPRQTAPRRSRGGNSVKAKSSSVKDHGRVTKPTIIIPRPKTQSIRLKVSHQADPRSAATANSQPVSARRPTRQSRKKYDSDTDDYVPSD